MPVMYGAEFDHDIPFKATGLRPISREPANNTDTAREHPDPE
jgi:hypothetical protein